MKTCEHRKKLERNIIHFYHRLRVLLGYEINEDNVWNRWKNGEISFSLPKILQERFVHSGRWTTGAEGGRSESPGRDASLENDVIILLAAPSKFLYSNTSRTNGYSRQRDVFHFLLYDVAARYGIFRNWIFIVMYFWLSGLQTSIHCERRRNEVEIGSEK